MKDKLKIGTILFTWHRSEHTRKVLEALSENDVLPEQLYIFQDGIGPKANIAEWNKVNKLIQEVNFCKTYVIVAGTNKGLRKSVVDGLNYVLKECDAVIVLEDDCVTNVQFMRFMISALEYYRDEKNVYSVSGCNDWIELDKKHDCDAFFSGRSCSLGWGTWKDRWAIYEENYDIINEIKKDKQAYGRLQIWGSDLEGMLIGNISGNCSSWSVFWSLNIIKRGGYCLSPYKNMVYNIGFDGSGVHSGVGGYYQNEVSTQGREDKVSFRFPAYIESTKECEEEVRFIFGSAGGQQKHKYYHRLLIKWIQMKQKGQGLRLPMEIGNDIAVWGKGEIFDILNAEIGEQLNIRYIIERLPNVKKYNDTPVISINELGNNVKDIIVIPCFDIERITSKVNRVRPDVRLWELDKLIDRAF